MNGLGELVERQRQDLSAAVAMVHTAYSETQRLSEANEELARAHEELQGRLAQAGRSTSPRWTS